MPPLSNLLTTLISLLLPLFLHGSQLDNIQSYLSQWHQDFDQIQIQLNEEKSAITIQNAKGLRLLSQDLDPNSYERSAFKAISSLMFRQPTKHSGKSHHTLQTTLFWDYKSRHNPAILEMLAYNFERPSTEQAYEEALNFWIFFVWLKNNGGRSSLRNNQSKNQTPPWLEANQPLSELQLLQIVSHIDKYASPVESPSKSSQKLKSFLFIKREKHRISLENSPSCLPNCADNHHFLKTRLGRIKKELPSVNPLYFNTYRSLGICYEQLINGNTALFKNSWEEFTHDYNFSEQIKTELFSSD